MIISDKHRFILVHIPKCAGVSVKKSLRPIDDSEGGFSRIGEHEVLGKLHFAHIPLGDLEVHFPDVYAKLLAYRSVALVRNPIDRFVSAVFQRLREFKGFNQSAITEAVFLAEAEMLMQHLASAPDRLDLEHVHFNRQSDYIFNRGRQVVSQVFRLDQLQLASDFIESCTGIRIEDEDRLNRSAEIKAGPFKPIIRFVRMPYAMVFPVSVRQQIRSSLMRLGIYGDVQKDRFVRPGGELDRFLHDHYGEDFQIFANARHVIPPVARGSADVQCPILQ